MHVMKRGTSNMNVNDYVKDVEVIDYTHAGLGVAKGNENIYFIKNALIGEVVDIKIKKKIKKIFFADVVEIKKESINRVKPKCIHYNVCGGCNLQHMNYKEQISLKESTYKNSAKKMKIHLNPQVKESPLEFGYRNKVKFSIEAINNGFTIGFLKEKSHKVIPINKCDLISIGMNEIKDSISKILNDSTEEKWNFKELTIRENLVNEYLIILTTNDRDLKKYNLILKKIEKINNVIQVQINNKKNKIITENKVFMDKIGKMSYKISPEAFFQINNKQTENIYNKVFELLPSVTNITLDAYCGAGTIGQYISPKTKNIVGIEIVPSAIFDAKENAINNNISNSEYIQGDIEKEIAKFYSKDKKFDTVIVDPPRRGLNDKFKKLLLTYKPKTIIYVSCNPTTLFRDINTLQQEYEISDISLYDMFPQTIHIESVAKLELK